MARKIALRFKVRLMSDIPAEEWVSFVEAETQGTAASSRERYLNTFMSFINWCAARPRQWITDKTIPHFERDAAARKPKNRQRRHVAEWRTDLIMLLIDNAGPHLSPNSGCSGRRASASLPC